MEAVRDPDDRGFGLPRRITYLIDPDGVIVRSYRVTKEDLAGHADQVLADLAAAKAAQSL
jgi:peroxiredoxin